MLGRHFFRALVLLVSLLLLAAPSAAQVTEMSVNACLGKKLKKVGASAGGRAKCVAKAVKKDTSPVACLLQQVDKFTGGDRPERGAFAKLESKGECLTTDDGGTLEGTLASLDNDLTAAVGANAPSKCDGAKLVCTQKYLTSRMGCYAKAAKKSGLVDVGCLAKREAQLTACYTKANAKPDCTNESTAEAPAVLVDNFITLSVCTLDPAACAVPDSLDVFLPDGFLRLEGVSRTAFNPVGATLDLRLIGTEFGTFASDFEVTVNGTAIDPGQLTLGTKSIQVVGALVDGRNDVDFSGVDIAGRGLYLQETIWAGSATLTVNLVAENGSSFNSAATVRASLVDDESVAAEGIATGGSIVFENVPFRTILARAEAKGNALGIAGFLGSAGTVEIPMIAFGNPSDIDNNDFSLGTDGWEVGDAPVVVVPHDEGAAVPLSSARGVGPDPEPNADMALSTGGVEGERSARRTFVTRPDTTAVRVRYRFVTTEVPGGFYGSQFNDYYRVSLRSVKGKGVISETRGMNSFPEFEFDGSGATPWREVVVKPIAAGGDTVQVDLGVANVGDSAFDSTLEVDFVAEKGDQVVPAIAWNTTNGGLDLTFRVQAGALLSDTNIEVYFASGPAAANKLGDPLFTHPIPAGKPQGNHGTVRIAGNLPKLREDPAGTTHLLAIASPTSFAVLPDVTITYGPNAKPAGASEEIRNVIRDGLRAAGQASAKISSTNRNAVDQARAMFNNLVRSDGGRTVAGNIATQLGIYGSNGDQVITTYQDFIALLPSATFASILEYAAAVQLQMVDKINELGPPNVSRHSADPAVISVVDLSVTAFNAANVLVYRPAVETRVDKFLDERTSNACYHHELAR